MVELEGLFVVRIADSIGTWPAGEKCRDLCFEARYVLLFLRRWDFQTEEQPDTANAARYRLALMPGGTN